VFNNIAIMKAKKAFSQNFLINASLQQHIVDAVPLNPNGPNHVLEIGAGRGALTQPLVQRLTHPQDRLTAVEVDPDCVAALHPLFADNPAVQVLAQNVLGVWPATVNATQPVHVVGNLPYHMTGQILFHICGEITEPSPVWLPFLASFTLMVQQEVAQRICAQPGQSCVNPLTWAIQSRFKATYLFGVPASSFRPVPRVESAVVQLTPLAQAQPANMALQVATAKLIKAGFLHPRKTLKNNLLANYPAGHAVWQCIPPEWQAQRAHMVALAQWQAWAQAMWQLTQPQ
jgi:16S rRNA (adenine1518-N6/adenine1519-N6)-dimethyltransferase